MADVNIASFDLDAAGAIRAVTQLSTSIKGLEKELEQLQKEGKDTTVVQQQLAAATASLDKALKQETTTAQGATAQSKALKVATNDLANSQEKANKSGKSFGASLGRNAVSFKSFSGGLARGGTALANLAGGLGLAGGALTIVNVVAEKAVEGFLNLFKESEAVTAAKERLFAATEQAIGSIVEETRASNGLFAELKDGNTTQERRREISAKLNELYPKIIGNTNLLTASEDQLKRIQAEVNAGIRTRILLQAREQQTAEIVAKIAQNEVKLRVEANKVQSQGAIATAEQISAIKARDAAELERLKQQGVGEEQLAVIRKAQQDSYEKGNIRVVDNTTEAGNALAAENKALLKELETLDVAYQEVDKVLSGIDFGASNTAAAAKNTTENSKATSKNAAEQKALEGSLAALRAEQSRLNKSIEEGTKLNNEEELKRLSTEYANVSKSIADAEKKLALFRGETGLAENSLASLRQASSEIRKQLEEQVNVDDIAKLQALQAQYQELETKIKEVEDSLKSLDAVEVEPKGILDLDLDAAKATLSQLQAQQAAANLVLEQEQTKALKFTQTNAQAQAIVRANFAKKAQEAETAQRLEALRLQKEIAQAELNLAIEAGGKLSEEALKAQTDLSGIQQEIAKIEGEEFAAKVKVKTDAKDIEKTLRQIASFAEDLAGQVLDFAATQIDNTIAQLESAIDKQESLLDKLLGNEQTANAEQVRLEQERLDALNKEREKAKNKEAIIAQAQIAINLALAVARAAAEGGVLASALTISAAIAAAVFGFISARQAAQQAFYEGSLFVDDAHAPQGRDTINARLNRGEAVIPTSTNARYKKAIHGIYNERVPAQLANDFFANNSEWVEAMKAYKQGVISPQIQHVPVPISMGVGSRKSVGEALPLAAALGYVGRAISEQPSTVLRGKELVTIVKNKSSQMDKIRNKSKGING